MSLSNSISTPRQQNAGGNWRELFNITVLLIQSQVTEGRDAEAAPQSMLGTSESTVYSFRANRLRILKSKNVLDDESSSVERFQERY